MNIAEKTEKEVIYKGLVGVKADETAISKVIPEDKALYYRGYPVHELAEKCDFMEVAYLIWKGELPNDAELAELVEIESSQREISDDLIAVLKHVPKASHPMDSLRTAISFLGMEDDDAWNIDADALQDKAYSLFAKIPTIIAADYRIREGLEVISPDASLGFSENFFYMCFGEVPEKEIVRAFDISLICYAEHSFNASTFTARVIASSLADIYGAVTGAVASLKGPLHGGANEAVMYMLQEVKSPADAETWLRAKFANKEKVMGFGHRVYYLGDSRVPIMQAAFEDIVAHKGKEAEDLLEIHKSLEDIFVNEKKIYPNLDYPAGPAYYLMGFPIPLFTPIFVMARITGWTAHIMEQLADNQLIRPLAAYNGAAPRHL